MPPRENDIYHTPARLKSSLGRYQDAKMKKRPEETGVSRIPSKNRQPYISFAFLRVAWANVIRAQHTSIVGMKKVAKDGRDTKRIHGI